MHNVTSDWSIIEVDICYSNKNFLEPHLFLFVRKMGVIRILQEFRLEYLGRWHWNLTRILITKADGITLTFMWQTTEIIKNFISKSITALKPCVDIVVIHDTYLKKKMFTVSLFFIFHTNNKKPHKFRCGETLSK